MAGAEGRGWRGDPSGSARSGCCGGSRRTPLNVPIPGVVRPRVAIGNRGGGELPISSGGSRWDLPGPPCPGLPRPSTCPRCPFRRGQSHNQRGSYPCQCKDYKTANFPLSFLNRRVFLVPDCCIFNITGPLSSALLPGRYCRFGFLSGGFMLSKSGKIFRFKKELVS